MKTLAVWIAILALAASAPAVAQTPTGIAPGVVTLPEAPGAPLRRAQRIEPTSVAPAPNSLRLHRASARLQWHADEEFGTRFLWWLDRADSEVVLSLRVAAGVRYRLTCDYAPPAYPIIQVRDLVGTSNQVSPRNLPDSAPSGVHGAALPGVPSVPNLDELPTAEQLRRDPRFEYAPVRLTWRDRGAARLLTATLDAVPRNVWREVRFSNPDHGASVVLYGCEIAPIVG